MSARSVCRGTRPSRYHSVRAISMPFRRPELMILMPCAPRRIAFCMARFMARLNMMRFSSCCAIESAMSCASISGLRISSMFTCTCCTPMMRRSSALSASISSPFLPITTPGRAEKIVMRASFAGRSIRTRPTEACASFFLRKERTLMSSASIGAKLRLLAYHLELQLRLTASRKPVGLIFCPMGIPLISDRQVDVAGVPQHPGAAPLGARVKAFLERAALDVDRLHLERVDVRAVVVLGVGDRRLEELLDQRRARLGRVGEDVDRLVDLLAAHEVRHQPALLGRQVRAAQARFRFHECSLRPHCYFLAGAAGAAGAAAAGAAAPGALGGGDLPAIAASAVRLPAAEWLLKMRVSANSPSLCPTMFSVTYTGMCCLPLCTASVSPTKSGITVERRDQVLIGRLSLPPRALSTFCMRWWSTKGPF